MRMKRNGFEIGVLVFMIVFSLILFGMYLLYEVYISSHSFTILVNPFSVLECKKWDCKNVSSNLDEFNNKKFNVFIDGKNVGINSVYYNQISKKFYVFNADNENLFKSGKLFIHDVNSKITQFNFDEENIDSEELSSLLKVTGEKFDSNNVVKVSVDFDSDQKDECLYIINRIDIENFSISILVYMKGDKFTILDKNKTDDITKSSEGYVNNIIDIFNDGKKEFIYTKEFFSSIGSCNVIYRLKGNKFVSINECEIVE